MDRANIITILVTALGTVGAAVSEHSINLVDILKQDLRTNNDDYIESFSTSNKFTTEVTRTLNTQHVKEQVNETYNSVAEDRKLDYKKSSLNKEMHPDKRRSLNEISNAKQRNLLENQSLQPINRKNTVKNTAGDNTSDVNKPVTSIIITQTTSDGVTNEQSVFRSNDIPSQKIKNLMKFVADNKEKFNDFLNMKKMGQSLVETQTESMSTVSWSPWGRVRALSAEGPPAGDQLDMAPAKGGKIHALRIKNRLCQRSVMLPEGPKYDSGGRVYVRAYWHAQGRPYRRTRSPRLLLPRCCNCCKKSVLGCH